MTSRIVNKFIRPGETVDSKNVVDFERGAWGIDGVRVTATAEQLNNAATGNSFDYLNTLWAAQNGLDTNNGKNDFNPRLTMQGAFNLINTPDAWTVNILDAGIYDCQVVNCAQPDRSAKIYVNAPGATLSNNANLELFDPLIANLYVNAGILNSIGGPAVIQVGDNCTHIYKAQSVFGSIELSATNAKLYLTADNISNSTISVPDGAQLFVNITNIANPSSVVVLNPENVYGKIGNRFYPTSASSVYSTIEVDQGTVDAVVGSEYLALNTGLSQTFNFPDNTSTPPPVKGDKIKINGVSSSFWVAQFGAGVACFYGNVACTPGGTINSTAPTDIAQFTYIQNNVWTVDFTNPGATLVPSS